ncbi:MAG TPA: TonB-dependent receptor [Steroidobacteraceae bacterium]
MKRLPTGSLFVLSCLATAGPALAQRTAAASAPGDSGDSLSEVVVTALRRSESIQDVPAAVTALSGAELQDEGARGFSDYLRSIPNVAYLENSFRRNAFFIRGITDGNSQTDPTTSVYIDEAPVTESLGSTADLNLFDLDRVEVLRGPQGTLYGAGSMGGTIRFILNKPKFDRIEGTVDVNGSETAHGGTNYSGDAVVNIPIVQDQFAVRGSVSYRDDSGFIDNIVLGRDNVNDQTQKSARLQAAVKPSDTVRLDFSFTYQQDRFGGQDNEDFGAGPYQQARVGPEMNLRNTYLYSVTLNADLGWADLISASNYFHKTNHWGFDDTPDDGSEVVPPLQPGQATVLVSDVGVRNFTQETRLVSKGTGKLNWLVGGFFSDVQQSVAQYYDPAYAPQLNTLDLYHTYNNPRRRQLAGFGEVGYEVLPNLTATVGLRESQYDISNASVSTGLDNGGDTTELTSASGSALTKKFLLSYKVTAENLVYTEASSGFRPGGSIDPVPSTCLAELESLGYPANLHQSNPDSLWNYELGSKNSFLEGRLVANVAAFYIDWKNIQINRELDCGFAFTANVGHATSKGFELETEAVLIHGLTAAVSVGYTNAQLTQPETGIGAQAGDRLPYVPQVTGKVSVDYTHAFTGGINGYFRPVYQYIGNQVTNFSLVSSKRTLGGYGSVGLRAGATFGNWDMAVVGTNLFDKKADTYFVTGPYRSFVLNRPQTIGLDARWKF